MKCMFVTDEYFRKSGGGIYIKSVVDELCSLDDLKSNRVIISVLCNSDQATHDYPSNVKVFAEKKRTLRQTLINHFNGRPYMFSDEYVKNVLIEIANNDIEIIFLGRAYYGFLAKIIKKEYPNLKIVSFFHDIAKNAIIEQLKNRPFNFKKIVRYYLQYCNEKVAVKYSERCIVLNIREADSFKSSYHQKPTDIIPIFIKDRFDERKIKTREALCKLLFVGSDYGPNIHGIKWFCSEVMPKLKDNCALNIVGRDLEKYKYELEAFDMRITVIGTVDDLGPWYYDSDIVIAPIFWGTGMKTKTMEAIMFGKYFLGTKESICGYEGLEKYECNSISDYVLNIEEYLKNNAKVKYIDETRKIYLSLYSDSVFRNKIEGIVNELAEE